MKRIVVGMSGGLDSFVTALMLKERGFQVTGIHLELWGENKLPEVETLCTALDIPFICRDGRELFRKIVVESFVKDYLAACTPSPCCVCNSYVKWQLLKQAADEMDIPFMATGHYVRIEQAGEKYYIRKGKDEHKDQSYFLWGLSQEILSRAVTPLGDYTKAEVRMWALEHGYSGMAGKKESMGICFLEGKDYRDFIRQYLPGIQENKGRIVDRTGKILGEHDGLLNYTIGQKKGLPAISGQVLYVAQMDKEKKLIVAGRKESLETKVLEIGRLQVTDFNELQTPGIRVKVMGIGLNPQGEVRMVEREGERLKIFLSDPAWAVAPGQPVAFYRGDRLLGGGIAIGAFPG